MILESYYTGSDKASFLAKVQAISGELAIDPAWLMLVMYKESRLKPTAYNAGSGATGLIQFLKSTALKLGTTTDALRAMSGTEQLDWVKKYLASWKGRYKSPYDVYLAVFYPAAMGKADSYVIGVKGSQTYNLNAGMDMDRDGKITVSDVKAWFRADLPADATAYLASESKKK
ncbi:transglycosylase SLT domain-containing protein [Spirosoma sp. 48-14]|uniref:transglycosylase SLT domain-containing protein n=1 Tax=Spirosoma sp. 48-14 TaxID=1895854 RepID=UPI00095E5C6A|nr:transglycosylase SLT domain-containing protein [Spirosoma sp. 48-14]OJW76302.1 MAG: hypothetical protein BGO59_22550 [Spirosoma sp. 48-14]